jgi:hypothetical protein
LPENVCSPPARAKVMSMGGQHVHTVSWAAIGRFQRWVAACVLVLAVFVGVGDSLESALIAAAFGVVFMVMFTVTSLARPRFSPGVMTVEWGPVQRRFHADRYTKAVLSHSFPQLLLVDAKDRPVKTGVHRRMFTDPEALDAAFARWAEQCDLEVVREG